MIGDSEPWFPAKLRWISELDSLDELVAILFDGDLGDESEFCRAACRRAVTLEGGVEALYRVAWDTPRMKSKTAILATLWAAKKAQHTNVFWNCSHLPGLNLPISATTATDAAHRLSDLMAESLGDGFRLYAVLHFASMHLLGGSDPEDDVQDLARLLSESTISLTMPLISQFEVMIADDGLPELRYQEFLAKHPVLLDPLAAEVIDRHRLGDDLVTDFLIRRHDDRYLAVEIEKPRDRMFTRSGDLSAPFNHAFGQIVEFLGWLDEHVSYASTKLPRLEAADGLLVMGRRSDLSASDVAKLRRFCNNSRRVDVCTFDDLAVRATHLYESIRYPRFDS